MILRFDLLGETHPDFNVRSSWYERKVLPGNVNKPNKAMSDGTQSRWVKEALGVAGIDVSKATHAMRKSAARLADMKEVPAEQVSVSLKV